jgi:hypothetical protein
MAKFRIETPDGSVYEIEADDNLSEDDVAKLVQGMDLEAEAQNSAQTTYSPFGAPIGQTAAMPPATGNATADDYRSDFVRGMSSAVDSTQGLAYGLGAFAGDFLDRNIGIGGGLRDAGIEGYQRNMQQIQDRSKASDNFENLNTAQDYLDFAQYYSGYAAPQIVESILSGGIGSILAKQGAKQLAKRTGREISEAAAKRAGFTAGVTGSAIGQGIGASYGGAVDRAVEQGTPIEDIDLGRAAAYGTAAGALEGATDLLTLGLGRFGPTKGLGAAIFDSGNAITRGLKRGAAAATVEGATEGVQTGLEDLGAGMTVDEARFFDPTSIAAGAIGGGQLGFIGGLRKPPTREQEKTVQRALANEVENRLAEQNDAAVEQKVANDAAQVEAQRVQARVDNLKLDYAPEFTPYEEYKKAAVTQQLAALDDPTTTLGGQFRQWKIAEAKKSGNRGALTNNSDAAKKAFLKSTGLDINAAVDAQYDSDLTAYALERERTDPIQKQGTFDFENMTPQGELDVTVTQRPTPAARTEETPAAPAYEGTKKQQALNAMAVEKLGADYQSNYPDLSQLLSDRKYGRFETLVDGYAKSQAQMSSNAAQQIDRKVTPEQQQVRDALTQVSATLGPNTNQKKVLDTLTDALYNFQGDLFVQDNGSTVNYEDLAAAAGLKTRQAARAALKQVAPKLRDAGVTPELLASTLSSMTQSRVAEDVDTQATGPAVENETDVNTNLDVNEDESTRGAPIQRVDSEGVVSSRRVQAAADEVVDPTEAADYADTAQQGGFQYVRSVGEGNYRNVNDEDRAYTENRVNEVDQIHQARVKAAAEAEVNAVKSAQGLLQQAWNQHAPAGISFDSLPISEQIDFMRSMMEYLARKGEQDVNEEGETRAETLANDIQAIVNRSQEAQNATEQTAQDDAGTRNETDEPVQETSTTASQDDGQSGDANVAQGETSTVTVERKPKGKKLEKKGSKSFVEKPRMGMAEGELASEFDVDYGLLNPNPTVDEVKRGAGTVYATAQAFQDAINRLTGNRPPRKFDVYFHENRNVMAERMSELGVNQATIDEAYESNPYGFVYRDSKGFLKAHFILGRIAAGKEEAAFMHEIGTHVGIDNVLTEAERGALAGKIVEWYDTAPSGSVEKQVAAYAMQKATVQSMTLRNFTDGDYTSEIVAYTVQAAQTLGIEPTAKNPVGRMLRTLYAKFKRALRKLGMDVQLTPQNVVDLAYGAARIQLSTNYHGTGTRFRRFNHDYMGAGEGAQAFTWGSYIAQSFGIGKFYMNKMAVSNDGWNKRDWKRFTLRTFQDADLHSRFSSRSWDNVPMKGIKWTNTDGGPNTMYRDADGEQLFTLTDAYAGSTSGFPIQMAPVGTLVAQVQDAQGRKHTMALHRLTDLEGNKLFSLEDEYKLKKEFKAKFIKDKDATLLKVDHNVPYERLLRYDDAITNQPELLNALGQLNEEDFGALQRYVMRSVVRPSDLGQAEQNVFGESNSVSLQAIADYINSLDDSGVMRLMSRVKGRDLYEAMASLERRDGMLSAYLDPNSRGYNHALAQRSEFTKSEAMVSAWLDQAGIGGTLFEDAGRDKQRNYKTYNTVIYNDENLVVIGDIDRKTANEREGEKDVRATDIRFGLGGDFTNKSDAVRQIKGDFGSYFKQALRSVTFLHKLIDNNADRVPSARRWYDAVLKMAQARQTYLQAAEDIALRARDLTQEEYDGVNDFIGLSTFYQKWGYQPAYITEAVEIDSNMKRLYDALNPAQQKIAQDVFAHGHNMLMKRRQIAADMGVSDKFFSNSQLQGPYAPLKRFGGYVAVLKSQRLFNAEQAAKAEGATQAQKDLVEQYRSSPDDYVVQFFDTPGAAKVFAENNTSKYPKSTWDERLNEGERDSMMDSVVLEKVMGAVSANAGLDNKTTAAVRKVVQDLYFQNMDDRSARMSGARRLNRAGYEKDMLRSFLVHAQSESNLVAQLEFGTEMNTELAQVREEAKNSGNAGLYNTVAYHYRDSVTNAQTPIQDKITAFNSVYMLTSSVAYHVVNATQPFMVTLPVLAGTFNDYRGAGAALFKTGYGVALKGIKVSGMSQLNPKVEVDLDKVPAKYREMLETLQLRQLLDVGLDSDVSNLSRRFDTGFEGVNEAVNALGSVSHRLYQVSRIVEATNRISAAVAAYEMATKHGHSDPVGFAIGVTEDTQGNFTRLDTPTLLKFLPKVMTQYKKYPLMMAHVYADAATKATTGDSKEVKQAGLRTLAYTLGHAGVFAGAVGIPGMNMLSWLFFALGGGDEEDKDVERYLRKELGDDAGKLIANGVINSWAGVDLSSKLGQGNIFSPAPFLRYDDGLFAVTGQLVLGPSGATLNNFWRSKEFFASGDIGKGLELVLPKGYRTASEAFRYTVGEGFSLNNGDVIATPDRFSVADFASNFLGFMPETVREIKWTQRQQYQLEKYFGEEQSRLRERYIDARANGDSAEMKRIRREWNDLQDGKDRSRQFFNEDRTALRRQPVSDLMRAPRRQRKRELKNRKRFATD